MKPIQRTDQLNHLKEVAPGVTGVGIAYDQEGRGPRKARCPKCRASYCTSQKDATGRTIYQCGCGNIFTSTKM